MVVIWPSDIDRSDVDTHFEEIVALTERGERLAIVVDMTLSGTPSPADRRYASQRLRETYATSGHRIAGVAHVITSPMVRGILSAVYWLSPPPFPVAVVASRHEAIGWAGRRVALAEAGDAR